MVLILLIALCFMFMALSLFGLLINRSKFSDLLKWLFRARSRHNLPRNISSDVVKAPEPIQRCFRVQQGGAMEPYQQFGDPPDGFTHSSRHFFAKDKISSNYGEPLRLVVLGLRFPSRITHPGLARRIAYMCQDELGFHLSFKDIEIRVKKQAKGFSRSFVLFSLPKCVAIALLSRKHGLPPGLTIDRFRDRWTLKMNYKTRCIAREIVPTPALVVQSSSPAPPSRQAPIAVAPSLSSVPPLVVSSPTSTILKIDRKDVIAIHGEEEDQDTGKIMYSVEIVGHEGKLFPCYDVSEALLDDWTSRKTKITKGGNKENPKGRKDLTMKQCSVSVQQQRPDISLDSEVKGCRRSRRIRQIVPVNSGIKFRK